MRMHGPYLFLFCLLANTIHVSAQAGEKKNPLADIRVLKCSFPVAATGSWKEWTPKAELQPGPPLTLVIDEIDIDGGTARIGTTHTTALLTQNSVHFMERTMAGSLTMTTVLAQKSPKGTFRAVRSRRASFAAPRSPATRSTTWACSLFSDDRSPTQTSSPARQPSSRSTTGLGGTSSGATRPSSARLFG